MVDLVQDIMDFVGFFTEVAMVDPISAVLLLLSALIMLVAVGVFVILTLLGVISWMLPEPSPAPEQPG